jgi:hypothetical protein
MSYPFKIESAQNEEQLRKRLQTTGLGNQKEKLQMLWWLKSKQIKDRQEITLRLARDTSTVTRWLQKYRSAGPSSLWEIKKAAEFIPLFFKKLSHNLSLFQKIIKTNSISQAFPLKNFERSWF